MKYHVLYRTHSFAEKDWVYITTVYMNMSPTLSVDDQLDVIYSMCIILEGMGYECTQHGWLSIDNFGDDQVFWVKPLGNGYMWAA